MFGTPGGAIVELSNNAQPRRLEEGRKAPEEAVVRARITLPTYQKSTKMSNGGTGCNKKTVEQGLNGLEG